MIDLDDNVQEEPIGYCSYCKNPIFEDDDYVKTNSQVYHEFCWKQKNNIRVELNFENE